MTVPPLVIEALLLAVLLVLTAGLILTVRKLLVRCVRKSGGRTGGDAQDASEMLSKFRELHARGGLSDEEYRRIKTKLAPELQTPPSAIPLIVGDPDNPIDASPA